jgi:hypothetical protein
MRCVALVLGVVVRAGRDLGRGGFRVDFKSTGVLLKAMGVASAGSI